MKNIYGALCFSCIVYQATCLHLRQVDILRKWNEIIVVFILLILLGLETLATRGKALVTSQAVKRCSAPRTGEAHPAASYSNPSSPCSAAVVPTEEQTTAAPQLDRSPGSSNCWQPAMAYFFAAHFRVAGYHLGSLGNLLNCSQTDLYYHTNCHRIGSQH